MARLTKARVEQLLISGLQLEDARFTLEKVGARICGHVISPTFQGLGDYDRQKRMWDVLEVELGRETPKLIGLILAYTPKEWNFDGLSPEVEEPLPKRKRKRKAG